MTAATMPLETVGTLFVYDVGRVVVVPRTSDPVDLAALLRPWDSRQVRLTVAEGKRQRWMVIETEQEDGDGDNNS